MQGSYCKGGLDTYPYQCPDPMYITAAPGAASEDACNFLAYDFYGGGTYGPPRPCPQVCRVSPYVRRRASMGGGSNV